MVARHAARRPVFGDRIKQKMGHVNRTPGMSYVM